MDPLSVTASIIALLQATSSVTSYLNALRNVSDEQQNLAIEAGYLYGVLTNLRFRVQAVQTDDDPWFKQLQALGRPGGPLDQMKETLGVVVASVQTPTNQKKRVRSLLQWHWSKSEIGELLKRMQHLKSLIDFALASDHFALSQSTHAGVESLIQGISRLETNANQESKSKISLWLGVPDPFLNH